MTKTYKVKDVVVPLTSVAGCPIGLTTDTRCVVRKVDAQGRKVRVQREDGRTAQTFTLDFDAVRRFGG